MFTGDFYQNRTERLFTRDFGAQKGDYGKLLCIGGSFGMAGAAFLSGLAAFRSGIGMVRYFGPECNRTILQTLLPEAMYTSGSLSSASTCSGFRSLESAPEDVLSEEALGTALSWADAVIAGPGLSTGGFAREIMHFLLKADLSRKRIVLFDADALNIIADEGLGFPGPAGGEKTNIVITPHVGEMSRLTGKSIGEIKMHPEETALSYSRKEQVVTVLKDAVTVIASPEGEVFLNNSGHAAMAKAGSGDVLTGVIAGVTAVLKEDVLAGAVCADYIHGRAGELAAARFGDHGTLARDIANEIPNVMRKENGTGL